MADFLQPTMNERGYSTSRDEIGNLIGRIGTGRTKVLLLGHLDTVEGEIPVREKDGKLYGRGAVDAKSALATFIEVGSEFEDSGGLEIRVVGVVEEETSSKGAYEYLDATKPGYKPDYAVVGEPSGWEGITLGYRGSIRLNYSLNKPKAHHGKGAPLPAEEALTFFRKIKSNFNPDAPDFHSTSVRLTDIRTESEPFQESVTMKLDIRTSPGFNKKDLDEFIKEHSHQASVDITGLIPPVRSSKKTRLVSAFIGGVREAGGTPRFKFKTGTADMNILAKNWDSPVIAYGPGDSSLDHTPDEHIDLNELSRARRVLTGALKRLNSQGGEVRATT